MAIWQTSWRSSLAAAAIAAVVGTSTAAEEEAADSGGEEVASEREVAEEAHAEAIERIETEIEQLTEREAAADERKLKLRSEEALSEVGMAKRLAASRHVPGEAVLRRIDNDVDRVMRLEEEIAALYRQRKREEAQALESVVQVIKRRMNASERRTFDLVRSAKLLMAAGRKELVKELIRAAEENARDMDQRESQEHGPATISPPATQSARRDSHRQIEFRGERLEDYRHPTIDELREEMNEIRSQMDEMRILLQETLQQLKRERESHDDPADTDHDKQAETAKGVVRKVIKGAPFPIELSIGADNGLQQGDEVVVYQNDRYLARAEVKEVRRHLASAALVDGTVEGAIQEGDRVAVRVQAK